MKKKEDIKHFAHSGLMDLSSYRAEKAELNTEWDNYISNSDQSSIFSSSTYLNSLNLTEGHWNILKKDQKVAVLSLNQIDSRNLFLHDLVIYNGILFGPRDPNMNDSQIHSEQYRIISFCVDFLTKNYESIILSTHPNFSDLRPFLWHNYSENKLPQFNFDIRYTSHISLEKSYSANDLENNELYKKANKSRRQEIRYGLKENTIVSSEFSIDDFLSLYQSTFSRQDLDVQDTLPTLHSLLQALENDNKLKIYVAKSGNEELLSIAIFGTFSNKAYYLFGANNPEFRDKSSGTLVIWKALQNLAEQGFQLVDMEGVNSPARGYFKMSFGGKLIPYYHVQLKKA